tara:strand:+ start:223 stop:378 length:156 start_codon:yes stop_codon:yes gene_type:complete
MKCAVCGASGGQVGFLHTEGLAVCFTCISKMILKSIADMDFYKNMRGESDE